MSDSLSRIIHTLEFLELFKLRLSSDSDINDLKILRQTPAIAVVGLVSRGKSTLVNKLIGVDLLPTGPNPVTFGNGFLTSGEARALGRDKKGKTIELPATPEEFRHRARRHDAQDIIDFNYSGALRIPKNVMLIDTKGLDEISTNFSDDLVELERSWASQGAMAAIMVTSVPPGMSAQDALLFKSLNEHFRGNVVVVVKQTDSSLSSEEVREAASVWNGHGAEVIHISDLRPIKEEDWGLGPLSQLELRMAQFWALSNKFKQDATSRLEDSITFLAETIKAPTSRTTNREEKLEYLWKALADPRLMPSVTSVVRDRLHQTYSKYGSTPKDAEGLNLTLRFAKIGSQEAIIHLRDSLRSSTKLRSTTNLTDLIEIIRATIPKNLHQVLEYADITSDNEYNLVSRLVDEIYDSGGDWTKVIDLCHRYSSKISKEQQLLHLMESGGNLTSKKLLSDLFSIWNKHLSDTKSQIAGNGFAVSVLKSKEKNFEAISIDISKNIQRSLSEIMKLSENWGENEFTYYRRRRRYGYMMEEDHFFKQLVNRGDHVSQILTRVSYLATFADPQTQQLIAESLTTMGENSKRQIWAKRCLNIENHNKQFADAYTTGFGWIALLSAFICFFTLANKAYGWSMFFATLALTAWLKWYLSQASDPINLRPFSDKAELKSLETQIQLKFAFYGAAVVLIGLISGILSSFFPEEFKNGDRDISVVSVTEPPPTFSSPPTTITTTTLQSIQSISSDDLLEDLIQDGRGSALSLISLPSDLSGQIGYAFRIADRWSYLSDQLQVRYCWLNEEGFEFSCQDATAIRFSQVTDAVIYSVNSKVDNSTPAGIYRIRLEISELIGFIESIKIIEIIQESPISTSSTLPYLTTRNRYWNADCPRVMRKNELLPLTICQEGRGVRRVQELLGLDADGYFGNTTHNAVLDFQYSKGLQPTGVVDARTWYELDPNQDGPGSDRNGDGLVTPDEFG